MATLGMSKVVQQGSSDAENAARLRLQDMHLTDRLYSLLDQEFKTRLQGSVTHESVDSPIGTLQYTAARTPELELVLLQIPGSILGDGNQILSLHRLNYALRGKFVLIFSTDLQGEPAAAFNSIKRLWKIDNIQIDFVPMSHLDELRRGEADIYDVLKLYLYSGMQTGRPAANGTTSAVQTIRIFLASSSELRKDRDDFELYFRQLNDELRDEGLYLKIHRWENFLDAMSTTRLQDEYNNSITSCDIFVSLFFTKAGRYTEEEFDTAHRQFKKTGRPFIYTFFKNAPVLMADIGDDVLSLLEFKKKLDNLGHFYKYYNNTHESGVFVMKRAGILPVYQGPLDR